MKHLTLVILIFAYLSGYSGCSDNNNTNNNNLNNINNINNINNHQDGGVDGDIEQDADPDAEVVECIPGYTECSDCIDNDGNGLIDGMDPTCVSPDDRTEGSFDTKIPGDGTNTDILDCWFDGNSGGGDDGCMVHICCMLEECPESLQDKYKPEECASDLTQQCIDNCLQYVVPGCDCFGCCTVCNGGECHDIFIGTPVNFPNCTLDVFADPGLCPRCILNEDCANPCNPEDCELCPGMTVEDLPEHCQEQSTCPEGVQECLVSTECEADYFCAVGCCIPYVQ